jgi:transposase
VLLVRSDSGTAFGAGALAASNDGVARRDARRSRRRSPSRSVAGAECRTPEAVLVGEIAGAQRFSSEAKLARAAGVAPIPVSSGKTNRHRLDRGGNRQINAALHRVAVTRARCHPETQTYLDRKRRDGKSTREAIRSLKRHLARRSGTRSSRPPRQRFLSIS